MILDNNIINNTLNTANQHQHPLSTTTIINHHHQQKTLITISNHNNEQQPHINSQHPSSPTITNTTNRRE
jgi:hypothetical protein